MFNSLVDFLQNSPTAYHACENVQKLLESRGFTQVFEQEDWELQSGGKYFVLRGGSSLIAFTVGDLDEFAYKMIAGHLDSPALKLKESPLQKTGTYATLNVEKYGGGLWYTFFDRPLKIAGRVVHKKNGELLSKNVLSPFNVTIPSLAIHQNRGVNESFSVNPQVDLCPLVGLDGEELSLDLLLEKIGEKDALSYDLFLVNADMPYSFGLKEEFLAAPRVDNLTSIFAAVESLTQPREESGIALVACLDNEEVGSLSPQGADGDFLENTLKRIAYALRFDESEYYKALASSFLLSVDNAHALHPNHPETSDPTNKVLPGKGVVLKSHAGKAYCTDATSSAIVKSIFKDAEVPYQTFFNRSDLPSGSTLGSLSQRHVSVAGADIGIPQLAMHSAMECFAKADYLSLVHGLSAYFTRTLVRTKEGFTIR